ncbi:MAG: hypothetical protein ACI8W7_003323, partial [Gammaproteobacteria bacterium]
MFVADFRRHYLQIANNFAALFECIEQSVAQNSRPPTDLSNLILNELRK